MTDDPTSDVQVTVVNGAPHQIVLVLEPLGEIHPLAPGEQRTVWYRGDPQPRLTIDYGKEEIKIWEEGPGELEIGDTEPEVRRADPS